MQIFSILSCYATYPLYKYLCLSSKNEKNMDLASEKDIQKPGCEITSHCHLEIDWSQKIQIWSEERKPVQSWRWAAGGSSVMAVLWATVLLENKLWNLCLLVGGQVVGLMQHCETTDHKWSCVAFVSGYLQTFTLIIHWLHWSPSNKGYTPSLLSHFFSPVASNLCVWTATLTN